MSNDAQAILDGDRRALARAITLIESTRRDHRSEAGQLIETLMPSTGHSIRVGISGAPGVGKSTFIEAFGNYVINQGHKVAVLTVDPSSAISGGSILGDKTVGVGQSETKVAEMTDMFVLLLQPGAGDELQGIKRGIMELADLVLVNQADNGRQALANRSAADYRHALQLLRPRSKKWQVEVATCSARDHVGIDAAWDAVTRHQQALESSGELAALRAEQARHWLWSEVQDSLVADLRDRFGDGELISELETAVSQGRIPATTAAEQLLDNYLKKQGDD